MTYLSSRQNILSSIFLFLLVCLSTGVTAQGQNSPFVNNQGMMINPVEWEGSIEKVSDTEYNLIFKADIEDEWHIYSQKTPDIGPIPLGFEFLGQPETYILEGEAIESETSTEYSDIWEGDEVFFKDEAILTQKIKLIDTTTQFVKATVNYQVCKEQCINQEYYFGFDIKTLRASVFEDYADFEAYGAKAEDKVEKTEVPTLQETQKEEGQRSLWTLFFITFLAGFAALLTPCVFPMIPMTVSYFTKRSKDKVAGKRNAILYALFIIIIYVGLGSIITAIFGSDALNEFSTSVLFNLVFFALLVLFAISFLGAFEIMLPNSWANAVDRQADRGGIVGIFFMALALAIVSFSCTGPIVGTVLVDAASKGGIAPIVGMLGFSSAIALPFGLFALFPGWLNSLPKSGGWLNTVKVFLGFLELAFAFKFLSNADLVIQAHWLEREVFLAIWIAIFGAMALYLLGKIKLPHDGDVQHISVGRLIMGLVVLAFTIYMIPGLWGAPLKLISGFPPPMEYSESPYGIGSAQAMEPILDAVDGDLQQFVKFKAPQNIMYFTDYDAGMAYAKKNNKPVMLDFTGHACVNCRKMEERVWPEPQILPILKDDLVIISLFVDAKESLPEAEQYTSETTGKRIKTVGNKWSDLQIKKYGANAQPYYVLIGHDEQNLNNPVGYTPDVQEYNAWLRDGIDNFEK
ncbi:MAG: thiol:disulfide interchange protein [Cytophagaceae bacterium]|nr:thiol:disulfide interchange protein [Cytophagaceae bacterium]